MDLSYQNVLEALRTKNQRALTRALDEYKGSAAVKYLWQAAQEISMPYQVALEILCEEPENWKYAQYYKWQR